MKADASGPSDAAYGKLMAAVIGGEFALGTKLPPELELTRRMEASRPVLRVVLQRLRDDGILKSQRGLGTFVIRQPHPSVLQMVRLSQITDIQDCFKFRIGVEGEAAYYAANRNDVSIAAIGSALAALDEASLRNTTGTDADFEFHTAIARASGNPYFLTSLLGIRDQFLFGTTVTHALSLRRSRRRLLAVQAEHRAIHEAIVRAEPDQARIMMRQHLENARRRLFEGDLVESFPADRGAA